MDFQEKFRYCPCCGSAEFEKHDFKSMRCHHCGFTLYMNASAAVAALLVNEKGELLVAQRAEEPAKGTLDLIGGFVDPGESLEQAVRREVKEETGIELDENLPLQVLFSLPNTYLYSGLTIHTTDAFFLIKIPSDTSLHAKDDVAACRWMRCGDIRPEAFGLESIQKGIKAFLES